VSPRPKKVTNEDLFGAAPAVMTRVGPGELTLGAIAAAAGVTPAVIVQRFGSKRRLLLALAERSARATDSFFAELARQHQSPLAAIRAYSVCMADLAASPPAFARSLAYLQLDLMDREFRRHLLNQAHATHNALRRLIEAAREQRELSQGVRPVRLARTIEAVIGGSLLAWAVYRRGSAARWIRTDVDAVLAPYVRVRRSR
jgi:AcrR family transcriptional regulator